MFVPAGDVVIAIPLRLFLDAEIFCGWLERYPVDALLRQLHGVKTNVADLIALPLHGDVEPILLLDGVALALVVTGSVSLVGLLLRRVVKSFAQQDSARSAGDGGERITVGKFVTEIRTAGTERGIANRARGRAAREQADNESRQECLEYVGDEFVFHKC